MDYTGPISVTQFGERCQYWKAPSGRYPLYNILENEKNFCRNPTNDPKGSWCYTENDNYSYGQWNYCSCTGFYYMFFYIFLKKKIENIKYEKSLNI